MKHRGAVLCSVLLVAVVARGARTPAQGASEGLRANEYDTVALIFDEELAALGKRALYPICISTTSDTPLKPLLRYLRRGGYPVSNLSLCEPNTGKHPNHPSDYSHGMRILIDRPQRHSGGLVDLHVQTDDLTVRPGDHLALTLRRGTYHFRRSEEGEWQIVGYTREYEFKDEEKQPCNCNASP